MEHLLNFTPHHDNNYLDHSISDQTLITHDSSGLLDHSNLINGHSGTLMDQTSQLPYPNYQMPPNHEIHPSNNIPPQLPPECVDQVTPSDVWNLLRNPWKLIFRSSPAC